MALLSPPAIDYGDRLRAGVLIPSGNSVAEPELRAMLPFGSSMLVTRLPLLGSSRTELIGMMDQLEAASKLLADAKVDVIVFHCTAVSTFAPDLAQGIRERIERATAIRSFTTADAILNALTQLGAKRVSLLTPYIDEVHAREAAFLQTNGFVVEGGANLGINTNTEMASLRPEAILDWAKENSHRSADVCFLSCTAIKSASIIEQLERALDMPVITSNQSMAWHLIRSSQISDDVKDFGRLFRNTAV
ncbi:maleate cis-trans isomerase family protein [Bradyrhizobium canariense]|uniref:Maleate isomerase n=1 Tax=Bradyrhizobium canariense TaxID=255045 RepID=A0A1H1WUP0_9BRAD|nr:aspartate/glutamate racemase family protein [Bradyrhizobium canariense]SDT00867.1 maleate isomerase [Bradyrhizobium canariense]